MKKSGVRRGVLVYKSPDPAGKMEIPVKTNTSWLLLERLLEQLSRFIYFDQRST